MEAAVSSDAANTSEVLSISISLSIPRWENVPLWRRRQERLCPNRDAFANETASTSYKVSLLIAAETQGRNHAGEKIRTAPPRASAPPSQRLSRSRRGASFSAR